MNVLEELAELLPTKAARWVALATVPVAVAAFSLPHFLSPLLPKLTEGEIVLLQILAPTVVVLIGSLVVLCLVLSAYHARDKNPGKSKIKPQISPVGRQDKFKDLLISSAFQFPDITAKQVSKALDKPVEFINYHFEELAKLGLLSPQYFSGGPGWRLTQTGREYAIKFDVVDLPSGEGD